jgi:hypothetical protein
MASMTETKASGGEMLVKPDGPRPQNSLEALMESVEGEVTTNPDGTQTPDRLAALT